MPTLVAVPTQCPKCSGALWDNRLTKKNPKQPDFKCRNRACDGVVWPLRNGEVYVDVAAVAPERAQSPYATPAPGIQRTGELGYGAGSIPERAQTHGELVTQKLNEMMGAYDLCFSHAQHLASKVKTPDTVVTLEGISAIAATIFIQASQRGLV